MGNPITKNRMIDGGDTWVVEGEIKRESPDGDDANALEALLPVHYRLDPDAVSATYVHAAVTLPASGTTVVTTAITNPDFPRNVTVKGNAAGIAGDVVVAGTNIKDEAITETIALNEATEVEGTKAFKTVTSITVPAKTNGSGDTVSVGVAKKLGLPHIVDNAALLLVKLFDGSADSGTLAVDSDEVEKNLFALNGSPNGAKFVDLYYLY